MYIAGEHFVFQIFLRYIALYESVAQWFLPCAMWPCGIEIGVRLQALRPQTPDVLFYPMKITASEVYNQHDTFLLQQLITVNVVFVLKFKALIVEV